MSIWKRLFGDPRSDDFGGWFHAGEIEGDVGQFFRKAADHMIKVRAGHLKLQWDMFTTIFTEQRKFVDGYTEEQFKALILDRIHEQLADNRAAADFSGTIGGNPQSDDAIAQQRAAKAPAFRAALESGKVIFLIGNFRSLVNVACVYPT